MDILLAGIVGGSTYALLAVGVSLIFGVSNIVNFAQGSVFAAGGMLGWFFAEVLGWQLWAVLLGVIVFTSLLGFVIYLIAVRPLRAAPGIAVLLATFAAGIIIDNTSQRVFGAETRRFPPLLERSNLELFGFRFGTIAIVIIGVAVVCVTVLAIVLAKTRVGRAIRATSQDAEAAAQMGIPVARIQAVSFVVASALGGVAGVLVGMYFSNVSPSMGFTAGIQAFAAATIGGLGSLPGAIVGGLVLGVAEAFGVALWGDSVRQLITFGALILVLWIRPNGILGRRSTTASEPMTGTFFGAGKPVRLNRWVAVGLIAAGALVPLIAGDYLLRTGALVWIYALFALSVTLAGGFAGQIVLGQAGALAIGAYTSALLVTQAGWDFWASFVAAGLVAAIFSVVITAPTWRLRGHYVSMATLATGAFIAALALNLGGITNGARGIFGIPRPTVFGLSVNSATGMYLLTFAILVLALLVVSGLGSSHLGRTWAAVREDEIAAAASGIHPAAYKSLAFGLGSVLAGFAGALYAAQVTFIEPSQFGISLSVLAVTIAILGGLRAPMGAIVGAVILVGIPELFRPLADWRLLFYGVVLLLLILLRPQGIWARSDRVLGRRRRRASVESEVVS
ncbi:ABC transporter permease [Microbacterium sp. zg.B48]|uniref:ABC transporter permease n=1 Tax=unclassified Microbacterium TaxID=2609290 RepID=UPI00214B9645|nr:MULTISPECIES: ABC transporter permease [unclassified Microbacterium]MCR2764154.1 ABC transporter permease [Microbacterium sp. zg.B48]MCR2808979.1 ABC transporter permease [Microbacterium sp. zg.B185]WIM18607.1 ABC transporter permease [Microbacterium sp. zg-B185]